MDILDGAVVVILTSVALIVVSGLLGLLGVELNTVGFILLGAVLLGVLFLVVRSVKWEGTY